MDAKQINDEIKALRRRISERQTDLKAARADAEEKDQRVRDIEAGLAELSRRLQSLQENMRDPVVTDHGLLRYLERVQGLDVEAARAEMLSERAVEAIRFTRTGKVPIGNGRRLVVKDMAVVSVV